MERASGRIQYPGHVSVRIAGADGGEVQRRLPPDLKTKVALVFALSGLNRPVSEPGEQAAQDEENDGSQRQGWTKGRRPLLRNGFGVAFIVHRRTQPLGGISIDCHFFSCGALWARSLWV
jgi:hypothetical protein